MYRVYRVLLWNDGQTNGSEHTSKIIAYVPALDPDDAFFLALYLVDRAYQKYVTIEPAGDDEFELANTPKVLHGCWQYVAELAFAAVRFLIICSKEGDTPMKTRLRDSVVNKQREASVQLAKLAETAMAEIEAVETNWLWTVTPNGGEA